MSNSFQIGQRWISDAEAELGLGTVIDIDERTVSVLFLATGETRRFAAHSAPLSRVRFSPGDTVTSRMEWSLQITTVQEQAGLLQYEGIRQDTQKIVILPESELSYFIEFNSPQDKLFNAQIEANKWFALRYKTYQQATHLDKRRVNGLGGARISLVPHQLYIADAVSSRYAPRVLLADEVGLGKTIEACLILNRQLISGRAQRALIIVPDALVHQWLVELLRRFSLRFSIFDEERCLSWEESGHSDNPFNSEQLVLCSLKWFMNQPARQQQALEADWDLLIIDEAHHLQWSEKEASPEYAFVEQLAQKTIGLLLLTATPEQLGRVGHFARLRLLDPDRFHDYTAFIEEEKQFVPIAGIANRLLEDQALTDSDLKVIGETLGAKPDKASLKSNASEIIKQLIDRHGTGRVLFRNTRNHIKGFPERQPHFYPLPLPEQYQTPTENFLNPEVDHPDSWNQFDTRIPWLADLLKKFKHEKILLICAKAQTAIDLENTLRTKYGIAAAVFHEDMSIIIRDRAAAYFADAEEGARILLCSEIGSEGRNFQFAHHLVLFDLPLNPDLLEQRIGRLDRIGQKNIVDIHIPYFKDSAQENVMRWFHQGLEAFQKPCLSGAAILQALESKLRSALINKDDKHFPGLLEKTKSLNAELRERVQQGRDRLLELSSFNAEIAQQIQNDIATEDHGSDLIDFMETVFDLYGVESEYHSKHSLVLHPGDHMQTAQFPELPEDGTTITFDRATALANEDRQFITWDHPMTRACIDRILNEHHGQTAVTTIKIPKLKAGTFLIECLFKLDCAAPAEIDINRFLPERLHRKLLDHLGRDLSKALSYDAMIDLHQDIDKTTSNKIVQMQKDIIKKLSAVAQTLVNKQLTIVIEDSQKNALKHFQPEVDRLISLQKVNSNIRQAEIDFLINLKNQILELLQTVRYRLDAVRLIIVG